ADLAADTAPYAGQTMWSPADVMAKTRVPGASSPAKRRSCTQYTSELAITSRVISSCALLIEASRDSANIGFRVPKASEWRRTETRDSGGASPHVVLIAATTSARLASSAALTLKNSARRPVAAISATIRSALAWVALRSRWTPKTFHPAFARAIEQASPNPEEAPRTTAQRGRTSDDKARES